MNSKETLIQRIEDCSTPLYVRFGFAWRGATWNATNKESVVAVLKNGNYAHYDICTINGSLGVAFYSANDML